MTADQTTSDRRQFLRTGAVAGLALGASGMSNALQAQTAAATGAKEPLFKISVAEYSLHRMIADGKLDPRDYGPFCKKNFGAEAVEYWMGPFADRGQDRAYLDEMHKKSVDAGVKELLIMCDINGGDLGTPDEAARKKAVELHYEWVEAAERMGCHSIRVNARSSGSREEQAKLAADGLRQLCEFAAPHKINVIVENHGGLSSDGGWLSGVIKSVGLPNCGTLPDFGNFQTSPGVWYDRYKGTQELMPYAKGVSAKSYEFDAEGNEVRTDYRKMLKIVLDAGYHGHLGIEWEGEKPGEVEGTLLTKRLLERIRDEMSGQA